MQRRTYSDWNDWKCNNVLPELEYYYPRLGFFAASGADNNYVFDPDKDPDFEYGTSAACSAFVGGSSAAYLIVRLRNHWSYFSFSYMNQ
ncbi:hypothetical protein DERF_004734 [Dermatophagoides farinae]|uniref:Uncharacterized protein n=1 Tax=Dermatophagoides farinae TaxID=6954 RepID=A0A922I5E3_DERFA|nr:hypothetical protein DERF_004734 [Dermatophagoides farinae]